MEIWKEIQRQKEESDKFEKELELLYREEEFRREEEEIEPMTKDDRQRIRDKLMKEKERLNEKDKLLQIT